MHASECNAHKRACTFRYLSIAFNRAEFGDDDENESRSGGSNVYSQGFSLLELTVHACQHNAHKRACKFLYSLIAFSRAEFEDDDENESFSGGSNVFYQRFLHF